MRGLLVVALVGCGDNLAGHDAGGDPRVDAQACPPSNGWVTAPPLPRGPTQETATVALAGKVYAIGGFDADFAVTGAIQIFDTVSCAWSSGPDLPMPIHHANAAVLAGRIYVLGALATTSNIAVGATWSWNPTTEASWTMHAEMPIGTARGSAAVGVIDGVIYLAGGGRDVTGSTTQLSAYTPATDSWDTNLPPVPAELDHACGAVVDGTLYVIGGRDTSIHTINPAVHAYTPGGPWVTKRPMLTARGGTACGAIGTRIVVVGGEGSTVDLDSVFPQAEAYDTITDTWEAHPNMQVPRHGMGAAVWNGSLYAPGGATKIGFGPVATHEIYTP